ncbi:MAG: A/G-specific adenine glycosylase [Myxococcota bacterium]|jgi:A/G-specific adenine glycosylase
MDAFTADLLAWYDIHRRSLPWRDTVTPYRTWISEVMLQQTRVDTVLPYFARFMGRFPTVEDLAAAQQDEVLSMWSGLGYYSRARNMHAAAKAVVALGAFPTTLAGVRALPGVGEYMAGAIGSIALGLDVAAVDGNLHRVLARIHRSTTDRKGAWKLAESHIPTGRAGDYNQALMDLGSGTCKPKSPRCPDCPVSKHCAAFKAKDVHKYPVKVKKKAVPRREAVCGVLRLDGKILIVRRPATGLYGGMYELPGIPLTTGEAPDAGLRRAFSERLGLTITPGSVLGRVQHTLTHMKLTLHVLDIPAASTTALTLSHYTDARWITLDDPGEIGISTLASKALTVAASPPPQQVLF